MRIPANFNTRRPFRRSEALRAGITVRELAGPRYRRIFHDVYLSAQVRLTPLERGRAALKIFPDAYVSHHTAATIWGGVPPDQTRTHISAPRGTVRSRRRGIAAHRARLDPDLRVKQGTRVSSPSQCFCELATAGTDLVDLVVLGDSLVRKQAMTVAELNAAVRGWGGPGATTARRAAAFVRDEVDSPRETRLRMLIVLAGLPEPTVNYTIRHDNGDWEYRFDLSYPEWKILIEYDGQQHLRDSEQWSKDLLRREELERQGWRIVVIQKDHLYKQPDQVLHRIRQALLDRGVAASRCRIKPTWSNYLFAG